MSNKRMSKTEFVEAIANESGLEKKQVNDVLESLNGVVYKELKSQHEVVIPGLPADFAPLRATASTTVPGEGAASLLDRIVRGKLIGREGELTDANLCWQRAVAGEGQV